MKDDRVPNGQWNNDGLLGTYFVSLFSMLLCFVMLLGTTFAWFYTDNTSTGNEIHSGILKVDMYHVTSGGRVSLAEQADHAVFSAARKWVPHRTQTEVVEIRNTGNVWMDYKLTFVPSGNDADAAGVARLFTVYVQPEGGVQTELGTLDEVMGRAVLLSRGTGLQPNESQRVRISLEMGEPTSPSRVMGKSVSLYLKLEASQHLGTPNE